MLQIKTHNKKRKECFHEENFLIYPDSQEDDRYLKKEITALSLGPNFYHHRRIYTRHHQSPKFYSMLSLNLPGTLPKETFGVESLIAIHLFVKDPKHILMLGQGVLIAQLKNFLDKTSQQGKERLFSRGKFPQISGSLRR